MGKPMPLDARGRVIAPGDFVCYTINSRRAGLAFGLIDKIVEKEIERYKWDPNSNAQVVYKDLEFTIVVAVTDAFANTKILPDGRQSKSGHIAYSKNKFLIL